MGGKPRLVLGEAWRSRRGAGTGRPGSTTRQSPQEKALAPRFRWRPWSRPDPGREHTAWPGARVCVWWHEAVGSWKTLTLAEPKPSCY